MSHETYTKLGKPQKSSLLSGPTTKRGGGIKAGPLRIKNCFEALRKFRKKDDH